jgi:hypothetical protein
MYGLRLRVRKHLSAARLPICKAVRGYEYASQSGRDRGIGRLYGAKAAMRWPRSAPASRASSQCAPAAAQVSDERNSDLPARCSFCRAHGSSTLLVSGDEVYICNECAITAVDVHKRHKNLLVAGPPLPPRSTFREEDRPGLEANSGLHGLSWQQERLVMMMANALASGDTYGALGGGQGGVLFDGLELVGPEFAERASPEDIRALLSGGLIFEIPNITGRLGRTYFLTLEGSRHARACDGQTALAAAPKTGWEDVDRAVENLRTRLHEARNPDDLRAVGLQCIAVLEKLSLAAFDPVRHLPPDTIMPSTKDAKARLEFFFNATVPGEQFAHVRKILRAAYAQGHEVKHRREPSLLAASLAAEAVIMQVVIAQRLSAWCIAHKSSAIALCAQSPQQA